MRFTPSVGVAGYGGYVPCYRIKTSEIARLWGRGSAPIEEKSLPGPDEDSLTLAYEAAKRAIRMANVDPSRIGALLVGSESPPYAVKPTASVVAEALGMTPRLVGIDMEFACKAGTTATLLVAGLVASGAVEYGLAVGTDVAQARPGDELEYTAGAGAAALLLSRRIEECVAVIEHAYSYVTDTPDFWRREGEEFPRHTYRFTGDPAYFHHIISAARGLMEEAGLRPGDFRFVVFHQPNVKFPLRAARELGFREEQVRPGLLSNIIGNTYAAATMLGLVSTLDVAQPGDRILAVSFGSGAGSDAISLVVTEGIRGKNSGLRELIGRRRYVDYAVHAVYKGLLKGGGA